MSRIGRLPITVPPGVTVTVDGRAITVVGPKGTLSRELHPDMAVNQSDGRLLVERPSTVTVTPAGTAMGRRPILDMRSLPYQT